MSVDPPGNSTKNWGDQLDALDELALDDLGGGSFDAPPLELDAGPEGDGVENSFADAKLEELDQPGPPDALGGGVGGPPPEPAAEADGLDLDLSPKDEDAVKVSALDRARLERKEVKAEDLEQLGSRGATGIAAIRYDGPSPAGHKSRPRGLFFFDPLSNVLAAASLALAVAVVPAWLVAHAHAQSDEVEAAFAALESAVETSDRLADPLRTKEGPQSLAAVGAALEQQGEVIGGSLAQIEGAIEGANTRFMGVWLGLGLVLGAALGFLRKPN